MRLQLVPDTQGDNRSARIAGGSNIVAEAQTIGAAQEHASDRAIRTCTEALHIRGSCTFADHLESQAVIEISLGSAQCLADITRCRTGAVLTSRVQACINVLLLDEKI